MKKILLLCALLSSQLYALTNWSNDGASTLDKGVIEIGIFNKLRYGITENLEIATHPVTMFLLPNVQVKKNWHSEEYGFRLSTVHTAVYPTLFLNTISREGTGGILPNGDGYGQAVVAYNGIIWSIGSEWERSLFAGISMNLGTVNFGRTMVDYPLVYELMYPLFERYSFEYGFSFKFDMEKVVVELTTKGFAMPHDDNYFGNFLQKCIVGYEITESCILDGGFLMVFGDYAYGRDKAVFPMLDVRWQW